MKGKVSSPYPVPPPIPYPHHPPLSIDLEGAEACADAAAVSAGVDKVANGRAELRLEGLLSLVHSCGTEVGADTLAWRLHGASLCLGSCFWLLWGGGLRHRSLQ